MELKHCNLLLREYREAHGITQTHIAKRTGKTAQRISALENGTIRLTADELIEICVNGFDITPANFFGFLFSENENLSKESGKDG